VRRQDIDTRAGRITALLEAGNRPDPDDPDYRADVAHHYEATLRPALVELDPARKAAAIGAYVNDTGIAPDAALDTLLGLTVAGEPDGRIAAARQLSDLLARYPEEWDRVPPAIIELADFIARLAGTDAIPPREIVKAGDAFLRELLPLPADDRPNPGLRLLASVKSGGGQPAAGQAGGQTDAAYPDAAPDHAGTTDESDGDTEDGEDGADSADVGGEAERQEDKDGTETNRPDGRLTSGQDAAGQSAVEREQMLDREKAPQPVGEASTVRPLGADLLADLDNERLAIQQGTSPVVRRLDGTLNYRRAPQREQNLFDEQNIVRDPSKFVVLRDPETNSLTVFERAPETDEGGIARAGRPARARPGYRSHPVRQARDHEGGSRDRPRCTSWCTSCDR